LLSYGKFDTKNWGVPREILKSEDSKIISSFLRGVFDSEGSVNKSCISMASINKRGIEQVSYLLSKLGINNKVGFAKRGCYVLWIFRRERFKIFNDKVGFTINRKENKLKSIIENGISYKKA
jgi:intein-encoded DNA endonuclease-like protein